MHTDILLVALNAKFSHTNLALRYLRESCCQAGLGKPELLELTINNYIPEMLGQIFEYHPKVLGFSCYIWNIQLIKQLLPLLRKVLPETVIICGGPEVSYGTEAFLREVPAVDFVIRGEGEQAFPALLQRMFSQPIAYSQEKPLAGVAYLDEAGHYKMVVWWMCLNWTRYLCPLPMNQRKCQRFRSGFYTTKPVEAVLSVVPIACPVPRQG